MLKPLKATQPFTLDEMTAITLYGITFPVVNDVVKIPTVNGTATVELVKDGKRKDWYYQTSYRDGHFKMVAFEHLVEALSKLIRKEDLSNAQR